MYRSTTLILACLIYLGVKAQDFTLGAIPDIQNVVADSSEDLQKEMQFFIDNKDSLNLKFVTFLGDYTAYGYDGYQSPHADWQRARDAFYMLRDAGISYNPCIGNHDMDYVPCMDKPELALTRFNEYFPVSEYEGKPGFGGYFRNMSNNYYFFSAAGMDFIIVTLQTHDDNAYYDTASIDWANKIIEQHADKRAIFITHDFYEHKALIDDVITKHDNLFLAICGHSCDREAFWTEMSPSGNTVHCMMADYQCDSDNGPTVRVLNFRPDENQIAVYTWNAAKNAYETSASSQFKFDYYMREPQKLHIYNVANNPIYPSSSDSTQIYARIVDDKAVARAHVIFGPESGNYTDTIAMIPSGINYTARIPEKENKQVIYYRVITFDSDGNFEESSEYSYYIENDLSKLPCPYNTIQKAFNDSVVRIPGRIQAENFNEGCNGIAYFDVDNINKGGAYRDDYIDVYECADSTGGYNIGWTSTGEFMNYRINVSKAGSYNLAIRSASHRLGGAMHLEINGVDITGIIKLPDTGSWETYKTTIVEGVRLEKGTYDLRLVVDEGGFDLNYFDLIEE